MPRCVGSRLGSAELCNHNVGWVGIKQAKAGALVMTVNAQARCCGVCCRGVIRRVSKGSQPDAGAAAPLAAALHDVEECLIANLVEIQRAAVDGEASALLHRPCFVQSYLVL